MKSLQRVYINPKSAVVIVVDMENEFCKPGGKKYSQTSARIMPGIIEAIRGLTEQARQAGIPIVYIQSVRTLQEPEFTVFGMEPHLKQGTPATEIVEEIKPQPKDIVVQKFCHDPFYRPDLDAVLQKLVPDPTRCYAVVTGGSVNVCLYHAVMGFYLRNYWTVVPVDCIYYASESNRQIALDQFSSSPYPSIFLSRSDLIRVSPVPSAQPPPIPGK